jgi:hypothetical protein
MVSARGDRALSSIYPRRLTYELLFSCCNIAMTPSGLTAM